VRPYLLIALAGAGILYALSRTQRGQVVAADAVGAVVNALTPRGIRNNNPGNIRWIASPGARWRGMVRADADGFGVFDTPQNGVRAIGGELKASIRKGQTIAQAIYEWAPPSENNTARYVDVVAGAVGVAPETKLALAMVPKVAAAIIRHENGPGPWYSDADVAAWVNS